MKEWAKHHQKWWGKWHLYLGLIAGLIVSVVGVTGSILVFQDEIDQKLNPELFFVEGQGNYKDYDEILSLVRDHHPELSIQSITINKGGEHPTYRLTTNGFQTEVFINPYTGDIIGSRPRNGGFISTVMEIHRTLMIPFAGSYIVGLASLILLILSITGIRLWLPKKISQLKSSFTVRFSVSRQKQNRSWHNLFGVFTFPIVTMLSLSGCVIFLNMLFIPMIMMLSGNSPKLMMKIFGAQSAYSDRCKSLPISDIMASFHDVAPEAKVKMIMFPRDSVGAYLISAQSPAKLKEGRRIISTVDQYSGKVIFNSDTDFPNVAKAYFSWIQPIHFGTFGGIITRILAMIGGLTPLILTITGFFIWWPRQASRKRYQRIIKDRNQSVGEEPDFPKISIGKFLLQEMKRGFRYALWMLPITFLSGVLYGLLVGIVWQPACFAVILCSFLAICNFAVALLTLIFNLVFLVPFNKGKRYIVRYFTWSTCIFAVYLVAYNVFSNEHICKF